MLDVQVLTVIPDAVEAYLGASVLGRARTRGVVRASAVDLRPYGLGRWHKIDDAPFGGGAGQVMAPEPLCRAVREARARVPVGKRTRAILLGPAGRRFDHHVAKGLLAETQALILLCGRYEGIDERVRAELDDEISLGDFVLTGGELAALAVVDAVARLLPGALGNDASTQEESFESGLLEYPHYTRPRIFEGQEVPPVLLGGDHARIEQWRLAQRLLRTAQRRPDLLPPRDAWPRSWRKAWDTLDKQDGHE